MSARTNVSVLRTTLRAIRRQRDVPPHVAVLVKLCESTAQALDAEMASTNTKRYATAALARAHLAAVEALLRELAGGREEPLSTFDRLVLEMEKVGAAESERAARYRAGERWPGAEVGSLPPDLEHLAGQPRGS